ncbi:MAG TPA: sugar ABC transporter substrate-binding protein [Treponemataceae bacterium]|nr:sugar ABC transporter substrate-binding protein [Treponemataceae bacterium]
MKKFLPILVCLLLSAGILFAAGKKDQGSDSKSDDLVNGKFTTTKSITVEIYDRSNDGGSNPEDNFYTTFIKEGMLRDHNVAVTFKRVPRWTEVEAMNNLLAANDAPDVCVTYSYPTIQTYANMGGVLDMAPYLTKYKKDIPNLYSLLGERNINWNKDPEAGTIYAVEALLFHNLRTSVFVREDWLKKLNIAEPKNLQEFEAMLKAFKTNAKILLGADADKIIPFSLSIDVGWRADLLTTSFVPSKISDKDMWINGFDDRRLLWPNYKEGIRVLNKWYNEGLIWKDFALYSTSDKTESNLIKAGYVGAMIQNWDVPYRDGDQGIHASLKKLAGPDAGFIAIDCFKNDAGKYAKYLSPPVDRKVFFPATNKEPVASLLYLDWISKLENRKFLQIGETGVTHEVQADGSVKALGVKGDKIMNSGSNIDYTITINGLDLGNTELNAKSLALGYAGVDKKYIERAYATQKTDARITSNFNVGEIKAEEGMGPALKEKRDNMLVQSIVAKPAQFDSIYDNGMKDYMSSGGKAIIDERAAKYAAFFK